MKNEKIVSMILMLLGVIFFGAYVWWAANYNAIQAEWGIGIWLVSVGTFLAGVITFFDHNDGKV